MNFTERTKPSTTVSVINADIMPWVSIEQKALNKMFLYTKECADEIGWLGTVEYFSDDNCYHITDTYLFEQQVHSTTTEITPEGLAKFGEALLMQANGVDTWNSIRMWGHSHVNMGVTPSGQDDSQMLQFGKNGNDYFIRLICNKKGELRVDIYDYNNNIAYKDVIWYVHQSEEIQRLEYEIERLTALIEAQATQQVKELEMGIKGEIKEKVSKLSYGVGGAGLRSKHVTPTIKIADTKWDKWNDWREETVVTTQEDEFWGNETAVLTSGANYLKNDLEVLEQFTDIDLYEFATCATQNDLMSILLDMGYYSYFTEADIARIHRVAKEGFI